MRVLVWVNYGQPIVMVAETTDQFSKIASKLELATDGWGEEEEIAKMKSNLAMATSPQGCEVIISKFARRHFDMESFQTFKFVTLEQ